MGRTLNDVLATLPMRRRKKIERRALELATLGAVRQARSRTQKDMADLLGVGQDVVSRIERRGDMLISTLRRYVEALGYTLDLRIQPPGKAAAISLDLTSETASPAREQRRLRKAKVGLKRRKTAA